MESRTTSCQGKSRREGRIGTDAGAPHIPRTWGSPSQTTGQHFVPARARHPSLEGLTERQDEDGHRRPDADLVHVASRTPRRNLHVDSQTTLRIPTRRTLRTNETWPWRCSQPSADDQRSRDPSVPEEPVAKVERSVAAASKASTRKPDAGTTAISYQYFLSHLATRTRNIISVPGT